MESRHDRFGSGRGRDIPLLNSAMCPAKPDGRNRDLSKIHKMDDCQLLLGPFTNTSGPRRLNWRTGLVGRVESSRLAVWTLGIRRRAAKTRPARQNSCNEPLTPKSERGDSVPFLFASRRLPARRKAFRSSGCAIVEKRCRSTLCPLLPLNEKRGRCRLALLQALTC